MAVTPFPFGLPTGIHIDALREQAKELLKSVQGVEPAALDRIKPYFRDPAGVTLQRIQLVIARERGFSSWRKLKDFSDARDELVAQRREAFEDRRTFNSKKAIEQAAVISPIVQRMADSAGAEDGSPTIRRCNFCFKRQDRVSKFIVGTNMYICDECVETCTGLVDCGEVGQTPSPEDSVHCSFCSKHVREVRTVIAGPGTSICNECVEICVEIITEGTQADSS
ncbi:MAG: hypothetical protein OXH68_16230 [Gammaproteobacteria bacterium]|nr:hypothetical protein [Gammaproteobacteria bacterium]